MFTFISLFPLCYGKTQNRVYRRAIKTFERHYMILRSIQHIACLGQPYVKNRADLFRLKVHNILSLLAVMTYASSILVYLYFGIDSVALFATASAGVIVFIAVLIFHQYGKFQIAGILSNLCIFTLISLLYLTMDEAVHIEIQFLIFSLFPLFLTYQNRSLAFGFFGFFIAAFVCTIFIDFQIDAGNLSVEVKILNIFIYVVLSLFLTVIVIFAYQYDKLRLSEIEEREAALEKSSRLRSAFLSNISHEIRTPMNSILGFAQILKKGKLTNKEQEEYLDIIYKNSDQLLNIVNDILEISKIETEEIKINADTLNVPEMLSDLENLFSEQANEKGLRLHMVSSTKKALLIKTDSQKVRQVLTNLLNNAIKFTFEGEVVFGYQLRKDEIEFFVKDTGIGIDAKQHSKIFDRFQQIEHTKEQIITGTGLGLSISKSFAELLGGNLSLSSAVDKGATFHFSIPLILQTSKAATPSKTVIPSMKIKKNCNILIAEDVVFNQRLIEKLLEKQPASYKIVDNGQLAVDYVAQNPEVDLVLMDVKMPILSGKDAMSMIKKDHPQLPVIAFTAFSMNEEKTALLEEGFDGFISKPVQIEELVKTINFFI